MRFLRSDVEGAAPVFAAPFLEECEIDGKKWAPGDFVVLVGDKLTPMGREEFLGKYRALNFAAPAAAAAPASSPAPALDQVPAAAAIEMPPVPQPTLEPIMKYFKADHLPPQLQKVSEPFGVLAAMLLELPRGAERAVALRKLLEAKDAAVRAALD